MSREVILITEEEMLAGLLVVTENNWVRSRLLLDAVLKRTNQYLLAVSDASEKPLINEAIRQSILQESLDQVGANLNNEIRLSKQQDLILLNKNMLASPFHPNEKPSDSAAHHISGVGDPQAEATLQVLYYFGIPTSHEANGAFMPRFKTHIPHKTMPDAYAHSQVHTKIYYNNVEIYIVQTAEMDNVSRDNILEVLRDIGLMLQAGTFPLYKRLKK